MMTASFAIPPDPFAALGLERNASAACIKGRYHQLARKYHPNRNYGPDESKRALAEHFYRIQEAWELLRKVEQRRRYLETIEIVELQDAVETTHAELSFVHEHDNESADEWSSSDADEYDLTHLSAVRAPRSRAGSAVSTSDSTTNANRQDVSAAHASDLSERGRATERETVNRATGFHDLHHERHGNDGQNLQARRRKLDRRKRDELDAFHAYRDAVLAKLEAEAEAEKCKERYERAKLRREKVEALPKETFESVTLARTMNRAAAKFKSLVKPKHRPHRPTLSYGGQMLSTQYLTIESPTSRSKFGGWNSDISGDQTSSDENTSRGPSPARHVRSISGRTRRRRVPREMPAVHEAFDTSSTLHPSFNGNGPAFQLLVKRPTGFGGQHELEADDDNDNSDSTSSRSVSPHAMVENTCRSLMKFSPSMLPEASDTPQRHHARSASAPMLSLPNIRRSSASESPRPSRDSVMFGTKTVGELRFATHIPVDHVHKLDLAEESRLLGVQADSESQSKALLQRLEELDDTVAAKFEVKPDIKASFAFRLICSNREFVRQPHSSFIALSYRRKEHVVKTQRYYTLPLAPELLQAVWEERMSDEEGLWIDQICIDQDSEHERTVSMSAMDLVYRSARTVVVVLDDIELKEHEGTVFENHMAEYARMTHIDPTKRFRRRQPPYLETRNELFEVLQKLLSSSWFKRAWCRHEMRLARDHIFLLPCRSPGSWRGRSILRFTSACLAHLLALATEVPFVRSVEMLKPALHAFFRDRTQLTTAKTSPDAFDLRNHHGNFTTVVAEVFGMEAGGDPRLPEAQRAADARRDKVSIILNTMECGLALKSKARHLRLNLSEPECYYSLLILALAARDPGALCSVGQPMQLPQPGAHGMEVWPSWLFEPTNVDSGLNNYRTLDRLSTESDISTGLARSAHYVQLDLKFLQAGKIARPAESPETLDLARDFVTKCEEKKYGRQRKRYLTHDRTANSLFGSMRDVYVDTLACVFECGPDWMTDVCHRYGVSRWKQDLQPACWLLVALRNMYGKWPGPPADWVERAAGFLMDFVNFLIIRGMPTRQVTHLEPWRPVWVSTLVGKVLTFRPPGDDIRAVIPTALLDTDYMHLARLWMLEPRATKHRGSHGVEWTLLGKSVIFGDDAATQNINCEGELVRKQQRVFGRDIPVSSLR